MRNRSHKSTVHTGYLHKDFQQQYKVSCRPNRVISVRQYSGYTSNRQTSGKIGRSEKQSKEKKPTEGKVSRQKNIVFHKSRSFENPKTLTSLKLYSRDSYFQPREYLFVIFCRYTHTSHLHSTLLFQPEKPSEGHLSREKQAKSRKNSVSDTTAPIHIRYTLTFTVQ